jgi:hypothetical protein
VSEPFEAARNESSLTRYLSFLELTLKMLRASSGDKELIRLHERLISHAKSKAFIHGPERRERGGRKARINLPSANEVMSLTDAQVRGLIDNPETSRKLLELVARARFHLPVGELSRLKNRDLLKERILTILNNRETHENLARLAAKAS